MGNRLTRFFKSTLGFKIRSAFLEVPGAVSISASKSSPLVRTHKANEVANENRTDQFSLFGEFFIWKSEVLLVYRIRMGINVVQV